MSASNVSSRNSVYIVQHILKALSRVNADNKPRLTFLIGNRPLGVSQVDYYGEALTQNDLDVLLEHFTRAKLEAQLIASELAAMTERVLNSSELTPKDCNSIRANHGRVIEDLLEAQKLVCNIHRELEVVQLVLQARESPN